MSRGPSRRTVQAEETKRVILDAARRLFTTQGYGATSVREIADEAGVAVPTVYASIGTKPTLLRLLLDRIDEEAGIPELAGELGATDDPERVLALGIRITRQLAERSGDIIATLASAAGVEPDMAATFAEGMARHRAGAQATVAGIVRLQGLRSSADPERAAAVLATLTAPTVYATLTGEFAWTFDQCESWLNTVLARELLSDRNPGAGDDKPRRARPPGKR